MKIFLTGGSGMVGRNIIDHAAGHNVEIIAPSSKELNLLDFLAVRAFVRRVNPDVIVHAAGKVGGIHANISNPVQFLVLNWDMGRNVLMAAHEAGVKCLLNLGSSCMYPQNSPHALREEDVLSGKLEPTNEGYAIAKCAIARLGSYLHQENPDFQYKTFIPCNLYGKYDKFDPKDSHLIPAIIHKLHQAKVNREAIVSIWGDGTARREFMYAGDLADAVFQAVKRFDSVPMLMNVGLGTDISVNEYYRAGAAIVGYDGDFEHDVTKPVGMIRKLTDVSLANAWGWTAQTSLENGLCATYSYYLESGVDQ